MNPRKQAEQALKENHFFLYRQGGNHEIYKDEQTGQIIPIKRHDFNDNDLKYILKEIYQIKKGGRGR
ncbi:MAG: type II toxin-antitoxin system HicA family toxin [Clostridia bacterium]